jgi:hypothetical protein
MRRNRYRRGRAGGVWLALVLVLVAGVGACKGNGGEEPGRRVSLSATNTTGGTTGTTAAGPEGRPLPAGGPLEPGRYRTTVFEPAASFRVGPGWEVPVAESPASFTLGRDIDPTAPADGKYLVFLRVEEVFTTPMLTDDQLRGSQTKYVRPVPADLVGWLRRHRYLATSAPARVRVGGVPGTRFDVRVKDLPDQPDTCVDLNPKQCVFLFPFPDSHDAWAEVEGPPSRMYVLDTGRLPLVISVAAPAAERAAFLAQAAEVLKTVRFG